MERSIYEHILFVIKEDLNAALTMVGRHIFFNGLNMSMRSYVMCILWLAVKFSIRLITISINWKPVTPDTRIGISLTVTELLLRKPLFWIIYIMNEV